MIRIDVLTTTRAEYGLMRPLLRRLRDDSEIDMHMLVTGTHLDARYGLTYREIEADGFSIDQKIEILSEQEGTMFVSETMANALSRFTRYFLAEHPDFLLVDGDRYETMAICIAAFNTQVPIIHIGGGETTEGAADEFYRHAITKMAYLHFPITDLYRKRVIQMGESPDRVFTAGSLGIENLLSMPLMSKNELEASLHFRLDAPYALITFHPVTLERMTHMEQLEALLSACDAMRDMKFLITLSNADVGGAEINRRLEEYAATNPDRVFCTASLGSLKYLSAMKHCAFVMGNSSSGVIETPSFGIPTINIGDRQKGRIKAESVIDCEPLKESILQAIQKARSPEFRSACAEVVNPNGDGNSSVKIVSIVKDYCKRQKVNLKKRFYDIDFAVR